MANRVRAMTRRARVVLFGGIVALLAGAGIAYALHGDPYIDLASAPGLSETHQGAIWIQGGIGAGTGNFDPFATASPGGSTSPEAAINVCDDPGCPSPQFDTFTGGGRTHEILLSAIPEIEISGVKYREFSLDANDQGSDDFMSIDDVKIFLDTQDDASGFDPMTDFFSINSGPQPQKVYDLDVPVLMRSQTFTPGSGVSDITLLVKSSDFVPFSDTDCSYGSMVCNEYVYFYFLAGAYDGAAGVPDGLEEADWDVTSGFEEWRTRLLPVVNVSKTANESLDRTYAWDVEKVVSQDSENSFPDGSFDDTQTLDLFEGESQQVKWKITWDRDDGTDSNQQVAGTITVVNPTGGAVIEKKVPAVINSVEDVVPGELSTTTPDCGVTFPYTLGAGDSLVCTYSAVTDGSNGTNVATVNIDISDDGSETMDYLGEADVDFTTATVNEIGESATLSDVRMAIDQAATPPDDGMTMYTETFTCDDDAGQHDNTATITPSDGVAGDQDTASVIVNCYELSVSKTANESFDRDWDWTIDKQVAEGANQTDGFVEMVTLDLFEGESGTVTWKLTANRQGPFDSGYAVNGVITITNPSPNVASNVMVSDVVPGGTAVIDCGDGAPDTTVDVPAAVNGTPGQATCSYSASTDGSNGTNTATATLFGVSKSGTAAVDFSTATINETDDTATWVDLPDVLAGAVLPGGMTTYNETFTCNADDGGRTNTARVTEDDSGDYDEDSATVDVNCYELSVSKTANESFDRDWDWTIDKTGSTSAVTLDFGDTADVGYTVTVTASKTDSGYTVSGVITITNPAPKVATGVSVGDTLPGGTAVIDCGGGPGDTTVNVPAAVNGTPGQATCSYSASTDGSNGTNTATATLFGVSKSGTAAVDFSTATINETDATVAVSDSLQGFLGNVSAPTPVGGKVFSYTRTIDSTIQGCGDTSIPNIARLATDDGQTLQDNWNVDVTVLCTRGQLTPTGTECVDFASETAEDLEELVYRKGLQPGEAISSTTPGAFIYWMEIVHTTTGPLKVSVVQDNGGFETIALANDGPKLFNANCRRVGGVKVQGDANEVIVTKANLAAGTYYLTVKYNASSLNGKMPAGNSYTYTFSTEVNNGGAINVDSLVLRPI